MKQELLGLTDEHRRLLSDVQKALKTSPGRQVRSKTLLAQIQKVAAAWFDQVLPALKLRGFPSEMLGGHSQRFERLLKLSKQHPQKTSVVRALSECAGPYQSEIIHNIEINAFASVGGLSIASFIEGLDLDEGEYLAEAQRCLTVEALRGCVVLGWCATIARVHAKLEEIGFEKFNAATILMFENTTKRYKFFNKKFVITSMSDLQRVFDTDLLLILEFMELIDGNQHERLRHCFLLRNNSAHPGRAAIKPANLTSFYSDISEFVLKNPKFALEAQLKNS